MPIAEDYHCHVYFDASSKAVAEKVVGRLADEFEVDVGHFHDNPVGPHPTGSCQVIVSMENFGEVMDWLAKNREGLTIFTHANTGDVYLDHTDHTIWMGEMMTLEHEFIRQFGEARS